MKWCKRLLLASCLMSANSHAFTDGSGWQLVAQLSSLLETATEQLSALKETLDVSEYLKEAQIIKDTKQLLDGADQLKALIDDVEALSDMKEDYFSTKGTHYATLTADLEKIRYQYEQAQDQEGAEKISQYLRTVQQMKNLDLLKKSQKQNMKRISEGVNDSGAIRATAHSMTITTEILARMEARQLNEQALKDKAHLMEHEVQKSFSSGYRAVGEMYER